jgi:hypothetical protein
MQTSYFVIKARGEQRYYVCPGEFTSDQREARVVDEATARRALPRPPGRGRCRRGGAVVDRETGMSAEHDRRLLYGRHWWWNPRNWSYQRRVILPATSGDAHPATGEPAPAGHGRRTADRARARRVNSPPIAEEDAGA